jgi:hypothetical protein
MGIDKENLEAPVGEVGKVGIRAKRPWDEGLGRVMVF